VRPVGRSGRMPVVTTLLQRQRELCERARDAHLEWLVGDLEVDLVLDVGANRGQFAGALRAMGYAGRVVSFEPAAQPRAELERVAAQDEAWSVRPEALGSTSGEAPLHAVDDESELGSLREASDFGRSWKEVLGHAHDEVVAVRRLDEVWDEVSHGASRVLLKLDTQGHDLEAFRGAGDLVRPGGPVVAVVTEVAQLSIYDDVPTMDEHLAETGAAGWSLAGLYPVSFDAASLRVIELDAVLVRAPV
jgi:FkbM family methyltransferase